MKNSPRHKKSAIFKRKYFILLVVCIITGFIIGYSYNISKDDRKESALSNLNYQQGETYRAELIQQQERNKELAQELSDLQEKIREYEKRYATNEERYEELVEQAEQLRLLLGELPSVGEGISVTLKDGQYDGNTSNPNDYIVHESHIFKVIQELKISGAEAIAINGQRLKTNSYISCNGPVITIDGQQYPAPFVIEAIGNPDSLISSLEISGGTVDQLLNDQVVITLEKHSQITMPSIRKGNS
ncbi:DUF881 domain-containing protein [Lysinibacillus sp. 54212]|uniref:DUF881 domain-containing protein n=1 Tax=Lysinibacillus sp. 54212 TaxID=3119829 RepID=UPI002FCB2288